MRAYPGAALARRSSEPSGWSEAVRCRADGRGDSGGVRTETGVCPPGAAQSPFTLTDIILLIHAGERSLEAKEDAGEEEEDNQSTEYSLTQETTWK